MQLALHLVPVPDHQGFLPLYPSFLICLLVYLYIFLLMFRYRSVKSGIEILLEDVFPDNKLQLSNPSPTGKYVATWLAYNACKLNFKSLSLHSLTTVIQLTLAQKPLLLCSAFLILHQAQILDGLSLFQCTLFVSLMIVLLLQSMETLELLLFLPVVMMIMSLALFMQSMERLMPLLLQKVTNYLICSFYKCNSFTGMEIVAYTLDLNTAEWSQPIRLTNDATAGILQTLSFVISFLSSLIT